MLSTLRPETEFNLINNLMVPLLPDPARFWISAPTGASTQNSDRNRYNNIIAKESTRVQLNPPVGGSDYINANFIYNRSYIATQHPLPNGGEILFWEMIIQQSIDRIVSLVSTGPYWNPTGIPLTVPSGTVTLIDETFLRSTIIRRKFQVNDRIVTHFNYLGWPDFGVPSSIEDLLFLLSNIRSIPSVSPLVVHCSAGVGRTGTFIVIDILINTSLRDPAYIVYRIRQDREGMVQTGGQYGYIYKILESIKRIEKS
jgi:protein-tyrosine phosphatase